MPAFLQVVHQVDDGSLPDTEEPNDPVEPEYFNKRAYIWGEGLGAWIPSPQQLDGNSDWNYIAKRGNTSLGIRDGQLWGWGNNNYRQLADGTLSNRSNPIRIGQNNNWARVVTDGDTCAGIRGGKLYTWGLDYATGQGKSTLTTTTNTPTRVGSSASWQQIDINGGTAIGINNGRIFTWGLHWTPTGVPGTFFVTSPQLAHPDDGWTSVACWNGTFTAVRNGNLYGWGFNREYQAGHRSFTLSSAGIVCNKVVIADPLMVVDGEPPDFFLPEVDVTGGWSKVALGYRCGCGIRNGKLYIWGDSGGAFPWFNSGIPHPFAPNLEGNWTQITSDNSTGFWGLRGNKLYSWGNKLNSLGNGLYPGTPAYDRGYNLFGSFWVQNQSPKQIGSFDNWVQIKGEAALR